MRLQRISIVCVLVFAFALSTSCTQTELADDTYELNAIDGKKIKNQDT